VSNELRATMTGLDPQYAKRLADAFNIYLANLHVVSAKLRNLHWNVVGVDFIDFHEELHELYEEVSLETIVLIIKMLGFFPLASMSEFVRYATLE
jgi:starvation-inducible DNA-binding protein